MSRPTALSTAGRAPKVMGGGGEAGGGWVPSATWAVNHALQPHTRREQGSPAVVAMAARVAEHGHMARVLTPKVAGR